MDLSGWPCRLISMLLVSADGVGVTDDDSFSVPNSNSSENNAVLWVLIMNILTNDWGNTRREPAQNLILAPSLPPHVPLQPHCCLFPWRDGATSHLCMWLMCTDVRSPSGDLCLYLGKSWTCMLFSVSSLSFSLPLSLSERLYDACKLCQSPLASHYKPAWSLVT